MRTPAITLFVVIVLVLGLALALWDYRRHGMREQPPDINKSQAETLRNVRSTAVEETYKGNYEKAIVEYERALKLAPRDAYLHNDLGVTYYHLGLKSMDFPVAEDEFDFGLEADARNVDIPVMMEMVKEGIGKIKSGIVTVTVRGEAPKKEVENYIKPLNYYIHTEEEALVNGEREFWITIIKGKTKDAFLKAEKSYLQAIDIKAVRGKDGRNYSTYSAASRNLGTLYFRMGRKKDAIAQWKRALEIEPTDSELRELLGRYE